MESRFVKICEVSELFENEGKCFILDDETEIALFKVKNNIYKVRQVIAISVHYFPYKENYSAQD